MDTHHRIAMLMEILSKKTSSIINPNKPTNMTEVEKIIAKCKEDIQRITGGDVEIKVIYREPAVTVNKILLIVAEACEAELISIRGKRRSQNLVLARSLYCHFARKYTNLSLREIGIAIGARDHTTVLHNVNRIKDFLSIKDAVITYHVAIIDTKIKHLESLKKIEKYRKAS